VLNDDSEINVGEIETRDYDTTRYYEQESPSRGSTAACGCWDDDTTNEVLTLSCHFSSVSPV